jgi:hypothetical protein
MSERTTTYCDQCGQPIESGEPLIRVETRRVRVADSVDAHARCAVALASRLVERIERAAP